ncbi:MAG: SPOR domain-containing protein, partial [Hyphomicrobium sp.]
PRQPVRASADFGFPRFVPQTGALRPSTLQEQAAHIERAQAVAPAPEPIAVPASRPVPAPAPRIAAVARGGFEIQIGAFGDSGEAERRMSAVRQKAGGMLNDYDSVAVPVQGGKLYRARFRGFDATAANETCSRLKSMKIDCFVVRAE